MTRTNSASRQQQILEALARMLETEHGQRITTAALAREVGVSEAALYRHFPSKTRMFEGLLDFIENTVFPRITAILSDEPTAESRCFHILTLILAFAERNPGISRVMNGDALTGETGRLRNRVNQLFERIETQLRQVMREGEAKEQLRLTLPPSSASRLLMTAVEGRLSQFVRSEFSRLPTEHWSEQWQVLANGLFHPSSL